MNVTTKRLDALKHPKKNVRIHSEQQIRELKRSLEKFGQTRAIVVDEDDTILIGNGLYEAIEALAKLRLEKQKIAGESSGNDAFYC